MPADGAIPRHDLLQGHFGTFKTRGLREHESQHFKNLLLLNFLLHVLVTPGYTLSVKFQEILVSDQTEGVLEIGLVERQWQAVVIANDMVRQRQFVDGEQVEIFRVHAEGIYHWLLARAALANMDIQDGIVIAQPRPDLLGDKSHNVVK